MKKLPLSADQRNVGTRTWFYEYIFSKLQTVYFQILFRTTRTSTIPITYLLSVNTHIFCQGKFVNSNAFVRLHPVMYWNGEVAHTQLC